MDGESEFTGGGVDGAVGSGVGARRGKERGLNRGWLDRDDDGVTAEMRPWHGGLDRRAYGGRHRRTGGPRRAPSRYGAVDGAHAAREESKEPRGTAHGEGAASRGE
jgi:hypothetical protein